jgi:biotin carboxyl carrier protein
VTEVRATMSGTVAVLSVPDGATVAEGEAIAEIECMKTFWPATAPCAGIVRFAVRVGEMVAQDQVLAVIETSE